MNFFFYKYVVSDKPFNAGLNQFSKSAELNFTVATGVLISGQKCPSHSSVMEFILSLIGIQLGNSSFQYCLCV